MTYSITNARAISLCDDHVDAIDTGTTNSEGRLRIYSGSVPADADAALGGATLLAELTFQNPAFGNASDAAPGATATANLPIEDTSADATGTAAFFRIVDRDVTTHSQGSVTATSGGGDLELNSINIQSGATVEITSMTITMPES
jgi:hypothetical protein